MNKADSKTMLFLKFIADANFYISVLVLVYGGLTAVTENYSVFEFNDDLYGAMHNNLRIALLYMAMTEVVISVFCYATQQPRIMIFVGYFLLMMLGSVAFYGKVNSVPIDPNISLYFLYTGLSHIAFGFIAGIAEGNGKRLSQ